MPDNVDLKQLGFGGGCHWCTEALFDHLKGVTNVRQGWIKSIAPNDTFSEAVWINYDSKLISTETLVKIHLLTHASASDHRMRDKYRSAIYFLDEREQESLISILNRLREEDGVNYLTQVLPFVEFELNNQEFLDYFKTRPEAPFCQTHIHPKLRMLMQRFGKHMQDVRG